jgi:hypothetical protein
VIDVYYTTLNDNKANTAFRGYAYFSGTNTNGATLPNPGDFRPFAVIGTTGTDAAVADTFAHEVGHFLLNGPSVDNPNANPDSAHSGTNTNLMASGGTRWYPGQAAGALGAGPPQNPPSAIPLSINSVGPNMALNPDGTPIVGGVDQLTAGTTAQSQIARVFSAGGNAPTANYLTLNRNAGAANRVDFDFVADVGKTNGDVTSLTVNNLDGVPGADNFAGGGGERLFFGIKSGMGAVAPSDQTGKDKSGLDNFAAMNDFAGATFKYADIFSLFTRYADSDILDNAVSIREEILDYRVRFRDIAGNESLGEAVLVFSLGWSANSTMENYVARWRPVNPNFQPVGLFVDSLEGTFGNAKYDLGTQIDAVIVAVPEPASFALLAAALGAIALRLRKRA